MKRFQLRQRIEKNLAAIGYERRSDQLQELLTARGLEGWLDIATKNLAALAKRRIANEIEAHYAEAVGAHLAAGETETAAQATALAELGDPDIAAWNFKKSHLTEFEARWMHGMERTAARPLFSFRMLPVDLLPLGGLFLLSIIDFRLPAVLALIAYAGLRLVPCLLCARRLPRTLFLKGLALSNLLAIMPTALALALSFCIGRAHGIHNDIIHDVFSIYMSTLMFYIYGCSLNPGFRIWNKLQKMGVTAESSLGTPPDKIVST